MSTTTIDLQEPAEKDRVYYRHRDTGELAYEVMFGEKKKLRLDRPNELIVKNLTEQWYKDDNRFELQPMQRALIALEADKALCRLLGLVELSRRDWTRMRDNDRIAWLNSGPVPVGDRVRDQVRNALWRANMRVLERLL